MAPLKLLLKSFGGFGFSNIQVSSIIDRKDFPQQKEPRLKEILERHPYGFYKYP